MQRREQNPIRPSYRCPAPPAIQLSWQGEQYKGENRTPSDGISLASSRDTTCAPLLSARGAIQKREQNPLRRASPASSPCMTCALLRSTRGAMHIKPYIAMQAKPSYIWNEYSLLSSLSRGVAILSIYTGFSFISRYMVWYASLPLPTKLNSRGSWRAKPV